MHQGPRLDKHVAQCDVSLASLLDKKNEFSSTAPYSYGKDFDVSVSDALYAKNIGIASILSFFNDQDMVLDALGGSGQVRLTYDNYLRHIVHVTIITGDIEEEMVQRAQERNLPAITLDVCDMKEVDDSSFNGTLLAYGFHHLPASKRLTAIAEAVRVTKKGGHVVVHDGIIDSVTDKLTRRTVDKYGKCPHEYEHPRRQEIIDYLSQLNIESFTEHDIFDPQVLLHDSEESALKLFTQYYIRHYGLPADFTTKLLIDEIEAVFKTHQFSHDEIGRLDSCSYWVKNKPYERNIYVGKPDLRLLQKMNFADDSVASRYPYAVVVPRYAKIFVIEV